MVLLAGLFHRVCHKFRMSCQTAIETNNTQVEIMTVQRDDDLYLRILDEEYDAPLQHVTMLPEEEVTFDLNSMMDPSGSISGSLKSWSDNSSVTSHSVGNDERIATGSFNLHDIEQRITEIVRTEHNASSLSRQRSRSFSGRGPRIPAPRRRRQRNVALETPTSTQHHILPFATPRINEGGEITTQEGNVTDATNLEIETTPRFQFQLPRPVQRPTSTDNAEASVGDSTRYSMGESGRYSVGDSARYSLANDSMRLNRERAPGVVRRHPRPIRSSGESVESVIEESSIPLSGNGAPSVGSLRFPRPVRIRQVSNESIESAIEESTVPLGSNNVPPLRALRFPRPVRRRQVSNDSTESSLGGSIASFQSEWASDDNLPQYGLWAHDSLHERRNSAPPLGFSDQNSFASLSTNDSISVDLKGFSERGEIPEGIRTT